ncbi:MULTISPECIES: hypothetical protein [Pseudomonadota]|nr:hypothetical protein [Celeribacter baekdonensis]
MKKTDLKLVAIVTTSVMLAGFVMAQLSDIEIVKTARNGFN